MTEIRQTFTADDSGLLGALKAIRASAEANAKAFDEMSDGQKKLSAETQKALNESNKALDDSIDILGKKTKATEDDKKATAKWKEEVEKAAGEVEIMGVNISQVIGNLKSKATAMKAAATSIGGTTKAMKAFRIALISTGIGALVVALGSLVAYFQRSQKGIDTFNRGMAKIGAAVNVVIDRFAVFGGGVVKLFELDFKGAVSEFRKSFEGIGAEIKTESDAAGEITGRLQEIRKELVDVGNARSKQKRDIEELKMQSDDLNRSTEERIDLTRQAFAMETTGLGEELKLKKENYDLEVQLAKQRAIGGEISIDEKERLAGLYAEINDLEQTSLTLQTELNNKINSLGVERQANMDAQIAKTNELKAAYQDFIDIVNDRVQTERLASLEGIERIEEERRIAIEQVQLLESQAKAAALAAGAAYDLDEAFATLYSNIEKGYSKAVDDLTAGRENDKVIDALLPTTGTASNAERLIKNYKTALNLALQEDPSGFQEVKEKMMDWLGLDDKDLAILSQSFKTLYDEVGALMTEHIDRQLEQNDRLLEAIKAQSEVVQSELEHQLELQAQGRSNNVESKRAELEELQQAEAEAMRERQRLEQQQMRAQLAADAARQISNMVTGVTSLLATEASKGVIGIGIAALAIPTFLALFRAAQSQARAAVVVGQRAYRGGPLAEYLGGRRSGFVDRGGRSDIPGRGDGYRVQGTDLVIGGDEFLMNERTSRKQERFMGLMNSGALDGYNLYEFFKPRPAIDVFNRVAEGGSRALQRRQQHRERSMIDSSVSHYLKRLVDLTEGQKQRMALSDYMEGYVEIDSKGNKKIIRK